MPKCNTPDMEPIASKSAQKTKKQIVTEASKVPGVMPLDYMLSVIRDETAPTSRRDRMAALAAPYCHPKIADIAKGKKDQQTEAADTAGIGTPWAADVEFENRAN